MLLSRPPITLGLPQISFIAVSSALPPIYFLLLTKGYQLADLSLVYSLATVTAILLLGERPSGLALFGAPMRECSVLIGTLMAGWWLSD